MTEAEFHRLFEKSELASEQAGDRTRIMAFPGSSGEAVVVCATLSSKQTFVSVFCTAVKGFEEPTAALLKRCLELNEDIWQAKFALSKSAETGLDIDFQFEVPARLFTADQLERCVYGCAGTVDKYREELRSLQGVG